MSLIEFYFGNSNDNLSRRSDRSLPTLLVTYPYFLRLFDMPRDLGKTSDRPGTTPNADLYGSK
jgi:hypothetical protein